MSSRPSSAVAALLVLAATAGCGGEDAGPPAAPAPRTRESSPADLNAWDYPALAARRSGDTWLACIAWERGADSIELRPVRPSLPGGSPRAEPVQVYTSPTRLFGLALAADGGEALHLVWSEQVEQGWALR
ncbi:MAG TPA: hypothetical protein VFD43_13925, partial [Planctomycetota bacterium]|nr:hypothetical protein [Planctomycetota bacterium]